MRYLSVCSGIEAASVAWHHLGWTPVAFSEIEPFPAAVLAHRFPNVPNYGDMTKFEEWPIEPGTVDLLVGGTPCQSFSVAGLRKGLEDPRGNLMLTYLAIAARFKPRWVVWENVPGVLSSNRGRDFGTFLGALGELGYGWAYRVLDAQYVRVGRWPRAVPQRRRRVFVVGCLGDWAAAAEALALREGLQRHLEASGAARKGSPPDAEGGARGGCWWDGSDCAGTLTKQNAGGGQRMPDKDNLGAVLTAGFRWQNDEIGLVDDGTISGLRASAGTSGFHEMNHPVVVQRDTGERDTHAVAFQQNQLGEVRCNTVAGTVNTNSNPSGRNTPMVAIGTDCYNGAVTGDVAATMGTPGNSVNASGPTVMQAVAFPIDTQNMTEGHSSGGLGFGQSGDPSFTVTKGHSHAVAFSSNMSVPDVRDDVATPCLKLGGHGGGNPPAVAFANRTRDGIKVPEVMADGVTPALTNPGNGGRSDAINVAIGLTTYETPKFAHEVQPTLTVPSPSGGGQPPAVAHAMTVRRLSARECERLQGFPDDWTLIPWRGKPAEQCPDGPRYKALGNSMACNCMAWIGERIAAWEAAR